MNFSRYWQGITFFFCQMFISSCNDIITKFMGSRLDAIECTFFRFFFGLITLIPFIFTQKDPFDGNRFNKKAIENRSVWKNLKDVLHTKQLSLNIVRGILGAVSFFLYIYSVIKLPLVEVVVILWVIPLFSLILSIIFLREKVTKYRWIATILGFIGLTVTTVHSSGHSFSFNLLYLVPISAAFLFALQDIIIGKMVAKKESNLTMLLYFALITTAMLLYPTIEVWITPTPFELVMLLLLGINGNGIQYFIFKTFSLVDVSAVAPYRYLELLISAFLAFIFFQEIPGASVYVGALILIPSTLYLSYSEKKA